MDAWLSRTVVLGRECSATDGGWSRRCTRYGAPVSYLIVFLGGGIGAALRHGVNRAALAMLGAGFPFGTFMVNVTGSYLMGAIAALFLANGAGEHPVRLFLATGVLGGFTTFSAFSLDAGVMLQRGEWAMLGAYVIGSVLCSIAALFLGIASSRALF